MFKRKPKTNSAELTDCIHNLQRITLLRDKCHNPKEKELYDRNIESMQRVVLFLSKV